MIKIDSPIPMQQPTVSTPAGAGVGTKQVKVGFIKEKWAAVTPRSLGELPAHVTAFLERQTTERVAPQRGLFANVTVKCNENLPNKFMKVLTPPSAT